MYWLFFRKLSFHAFNRVFLIAFLAGSFIIPKLEIDFNHEIQQEFVFSHFEDLPFSETIFSELAISETPTQPILSNPKISFSNLLFAVYVVGLLFCLSKLVYAICYLFRLRNKSPTKSVKEFTLISIKSTVAFSFFRWIYLPTDFYDNENTAIISHEKAHGDLWHSADLLFLELAKAILWFNPTIYLFLKSVKSVHEFQADSQVLEAKSDPKIT